MLLGMEGAAWLLLALDAILGHGPDSDLIDASLLPVRFYTHCEKFTSTLELCLANTTHYLVQENRLSIDMNLSYGEFHQYSSY